MPLRDSAQFPASDKHQMRENRICSIMQWRRRHCCTHTAKLLYLLTILGVLLFLVLSKLTSYPVVHRGGGHHTSKANNSSHHSAGRFVIVLKQNLKTEAQISPQDKQDVSSLQGDPHFDPTEETNTNQSEEEDPDRTITQGPFTYIINEPEKCTEKQSAPFLVLLIATEARQVEARNAIRQTWGNESVAPDLGLVRLFLLGKKDGELGALQQGMLQAESRRHHDIIQQDFLDSYKNLTIKTLMGMNWVARHCPLARYVMKTDSDMFINTHYLIYKLLRPELKPRKKYFTGYNMRGFAPNRNKNSKWYMPPALYPGDKYPTFCSGTGYVFSADLASKIYQISGSIPLLQLEDVYVGICLAQLRVEPSPPPNGFLFNHWRVPYSSCKYNHLITSHGFHPNEILKYWHHLQSNRNNACINMEKERTGRAHANRIYGQNPVH